MKRILVLFCLMSGLAVIPGCQEKCGPFPDTYFNVVGLDVKNIIKPDTSWTLNQYEFPEADSNTWAQGNRFGININSDVTFYAFNEIPNFAMGTAFACSPPDPGEAGSKEIIGEILITSDSIFDVTHPAGVSLNDLFRVSAVSFRHNSSGSNIWTAIPLSEFLVSEQNARRSLQFWLTKNPELSKQHRFTVKYVQTNGEEYIVQAPKVIFQ